MSVFERNFRCYVTFEVDYEYENKIRKKKFDYFYKFLSYDSCGGVKFPLNRIFQQTFLRLTYKMSIEMFFL